jgi:general L-amino acid transport system substrate-binding protein
MVEPRLKHNKSNWNFNENGEIHWRVLTTAAVLGVSSFAQAGATTLDAIRRKVSVRHQRWSAWLLYAPMRKAITRASMSTYVAAVAAAVFGDAAKVRPTDRKERFTALRSGEVDIPSRNTTWTSSRDSGYGLNFAGVSTTTVRVFW